MKQKELKFDIEKINDMKKSLSDSADDLNTYKDKVIQSLDLEIIPIMTVDERMKKHCK